MDLDRARAPGLEQGRTMITATARFWLIAALVGAVLVYLLGPVLTPFAAGALLAYLGDPLVDRIERWRVAGVRFGRTGAVVLVFVLMVLVLVVALLLLIPMLERQIGRLIEQLPTYVAWLQDRALPWLSQRLGVESPRLEGGELSRMLTEHWQSAGGLAASVLAGVSRSGMAILAWLANLVLIPVVAFYLMRDWDVLMARLRGMLPRASEPTITALARDSDQMLGAFMRGQLLVMAALAAIYTIGLTLLGVDLALLIGLVAGLISFVPYLGTIVGVAAAAVASLVQFGELWHLVAVLAVFSVGQTIEGFVLQPMLIGDRIGLHPVAVIFAIMAGGQLFGFVGVLLALPLAAVLAVLLRHLYSRYRHSDVYAGTADDGPGAVVVAEGLGVTGARVVDARARSGDGDAHP
jgi:predicted PurR-regulated permease PerM